MTSLNPAEIVSRRTLERSSEYWYQRSVFLAKRVTELETCVKRMRGAINKETGEVLC